MAKYMYYCKNCNSAWSSAEGKAWNAREKCPDCKIDIIPMGITVDDWRSKTDEEKEAIKASLKNGSSGAVSTYHIKLQKADEVLKYKKLLDAGAVSLAEYSQKKKELLGL